MPPVSKTLESYLGIDPGKSGGMAVLHGPDVDAVAMPKTEGDILHWILACNYNYRSIAVIEKVSGFIGQGHPGSAMFNFGCGYGGLRMALLASAIPFEETAPRRWQKAMGIPPRKRAESKTQWKNRLKARAQQLFPGIDVTLSTADALLIALYCKRKHEGNL